MFFSIKRQEFFTHKRGQIEDLRYRYSSYAYNVTASILHILAGCFILFHMYLLPQVCTKMANLTQLCHQMGKFYSKCFHSFSSWIRSDVLTLKMQ
jgi:hypothetical protein